MSELIDRETAIEFIKKAQCSGCSDIGLCGSCSVLMALKLLEKVPAASPWHRVDEPTKEEGKYLVAYRSSVVDGWGYDTAYYTKHLEDKMLIIPVPENSEGWFKWSDYNDCDVLVHPDYWMPIEPPKEDA